MVASYNVYSMFENDIGSKTKLHNCFFTNKRLFDLDNKFRTQKFHRCKQPRLICTDTTKIYSNLNNFRTYKQRNITLHKLNKNRQSFDFLNARKTCENLVYKFNVVCVKFVTKLTGYLSKSCLEMTLIRPNTLTL